MRAIFLISALISLWLVDISANAEMLTNGFFDIEAIKVFHIALLAAVISVIALFFKGGK